MERSYKLCSPESLSDNPSDDEKKGLTVWIAVKRQKFTARSNRQLKMHPHHRGTFDQYNFAGGGRCESFMGFPLLVRKGDETELVGVLKVESKMRVVDGVTEYTYFSELDELVFELIANSAALAIHNARLLESSRLADREVAEGKAKAQAWKEFSAMSAHRIGTEVARMGGAVRWLEEELARAPGLGGTTEHLSRVQNALGRLDTFVREFSEFAAPPALKLEELDLNVLCTEVCGGFDADAKRMRIQTRLDLAGQLPALHGDRAALVYSLMEMFQNAMKAMPKGGELTVITRAAATGDAIQIDFVDTGTGIRPEVKDKIFEAGFRDRPGGTGLGLAIVQQTVSAHGGKILENGTFGTGAHFVIQLPLRGGATPASEPPKEPLSGVKILVVEDTDDLRKDLVRIITSSERSPRVSTARNEFEAVRLIAASSFDVIVTDIKLDEEDAGGSDTGGLKVLRAARDKDRSTPVIVVSAYPSRTIPMDDGPVPSLITIEEAAGRLGCFQFVSRTSSRYLNDFQTAVSQALAARRSDARRVAV